MNSKNTVNTIQTNIAEYSLTKVFDEWLKIFIQICLACKYGLPYFCSPELIGDCKRRA